MSQSPLEHDSDSHDRFKELLDEASLGMLDPERQYLQSVEYNSVELHDIKVVVDSRANKTLSQINEEYDEDDLSAFGVKRTPKLS